MVEYALILLSILVVVVVGAALIGPILNAKFTDVGGCFDAVC